MSSASPQSVGTGQKPTVGTARSKGAVCFHRSIKQFNPIACRIGEVDQVFLGFQTFVNAAVQRPTLRQILPINPPEDDNNESAVDFLFEPSPASILENLLPRYIEMQVFEAILEAQASEQSARMVAMRQATDAANEMVSDLTLTYNKARQELITGELLDIVGGKAALEQD